MKPEVDKHIEGIYFDILRKMLENPDDWTNESEYSNRVWKSPYINKDDDIRFMTISAILTFSRTDSIEIYKGVTKIYELKIPWTEFKIRRLLNKLYDTKLIQDEAKVCEDTSNMLKQALGTRMERYIKLSKIRKKI